MNGKFFDLKKEKQDRMINGALKVFALYGYAHASTDEIVREAGISKGLLFHYFESKIGTYRFVVDYCTRFLALELSSVSVADEMDFFEGEKVRLSALFRCAQTYPYLPLFLLNLEREDVLEALDAIQERRDALRDSLRALADHITSFPPEKIRRITEFTVNGLIEEAYYYKTFRPDLLNEEVAEYLDYMKEWSDK